MWRNTHAYSSSCSICLCMSFTTLSTAPKAVRPSQQYRKPTSEGHLSTTYNSKK
ncbi:hypothetical protein PR003_g26469 [Phytophthora rubi]|uniref:RxLR effector protein n=1 Tax=Phytophthora rubi TaxID=129364 RepID=A0A6A3ILF6_9STRA|nr:hypothetical protein PR002_g29037 [Phytophthora rubi]KAE8983776.1 hypothetical protein PR001_g23360 [Phytophthora rubi]KAE9285857.1 hypothetical protein PR003_g26469 [Phytophthora rubi]